MDSTNQIPSFEIPKGHEQVPSSTRSVESAPETAPEANREILPAPAGGAQAATSTQLPQHPAAGTQATQPLSVQQSSVPDDTHVIAEDNDVIEKEWVDRAKKIISLTSNDPFVEAKELNKLKATYMKKRFNKDLPLAVEEKSS